MARIRDLEVLKEREGQIINLLHDYGPQRKDEIAEETGLSQAVVIKALDHLQSEGRIGHFRRSNNRYWILAQDI